MHPPLNLQEVPEISKGVSVETPLNLPLHTKTSECIITAHKYGHLPGMATRGFFYHLRLVMH